MISLIMKVIVILLTAGLVIDTIVFITLDMIQTIRAGREENTKNLHQKYR